MGECKAFDANGAEIDKETVCIANLNPFRYRSYYLDTETDLYFLKTRYYDPETGRFITIDESNFLATFFSKGVS